MVSRRSLIVGGAIAGGAIAVGGGAVGLSFAGSIAAARSRVAKGSSILDTRFGVMEFADEGEGPPLLMIHGTGGGFDQGLDFCLPLLDAGYRIISPSRFGYLRSDFPEDPSSENQADALVELLDYLGIDKLPVAGGSAGALPALAFAIRHPDRCSALLPLVPASYVPGREATPGPTGFAEAAMTAMLRSDFLFWLALNTMPDQMIGTMLATDPALVHTASPEEQARVRSILWSILPVSQRSRGILNDARLAAAPAAMAIETIAAPTLTISLEDDRFGTCDAARYIAAAVPGAKLVTYPTGGHIWVGHDAELFAEIDSFLKTIPDAAREGEH
jgi:pimeloyl-ACP methyl ester carboxylesterase